MYASASQLLQRYNAEEIAQRADASLPPVVYGDMLKKAAAGEDLSGFSLEEQSAITAALAKIERSLQDALQTINSYLAGRYELPLTNVPEVLERIACQLARYFLHDDAAADSVEALYKDSIKFLEGVSNGRVQLGVTTSGTVAQPAATAEMLSVVPVFGRDRSRGFI